jgi:hypothetical protein
MVQEGGLVMVIKMSKIAIRTLLVTVWVIISPVNLFLYWLFALMTFVLDRDHGDNPGINPLSKEYWEFAKELVKGNA